MAKIWTILKKVKIRENCKGIFWATSGVDRVTEFLLLN